MHGKGDGRHRKGSGKCKPNARAKIRAGTCGIVKNKHTCRKNVDCGSRACDPTCPVCQLCEEGPNTPGVCAPDPATVGEECGEPGQLCQPDGTCACDASTCPETTPLCVAGRCVACSTEQPCPAGCCAGDGRCQPGTADAACGAIGETCRACTGDTPACWDGACVCGDVCAEGCQYSSVQAAIDDANAGDTIRLCAGTFQEPESIVIDRPLTLLGAGQDEHGTVLDGQEQHRVIEVAQDVADVFLNGLRIIGGYNESGYVSEGTDFALGGGVFTKPGSTATLTDCTVTDNSTRSGNFSSGGGVCNLGVLTLAGCTVSGNTSTSGGGIGNLGQLTLIESTVTGNTAVVGGGGIDNGGSTLTLIESTVMGNTAAIGGGIGNTGSTLTLIESIVMGNMAVANDRYDGNGGGIYAHVFGSLILTDSTVRDNTADGDGGGIFFTPEESEAMFTGSTVVCDNMPDQCFGLSDPACQDTCPA